MMFQAYRLKGMKTISIKHGCSSARSRREIRCGDVMLSSNLTRDLHMAEFSNFSRENCLFCLPLINPRNIYFNRFIFSYLTKVLKRFKMIVWVQYYKFHEIPDGKTKVPAARIQEKPESLHYFGDFCHNPPVQQLFLPSLLIKLGDPCEEDTSEYLERSPGVRKWIYQRHSVVSNVVAWTRLCSKRI